MQVGLRKIGNSRGVIIPKAILSKSRAADDEKFEISLEENRIVMTLLRTDVHAGWEEDARLIGAEEDPESAEWLAFGNEGDADLTW